MTKIEANHADLKAEATLSKQFRDNFLGRIWSISLMCSIISTLLGLGCAYPLVRR